MAISDLMRLTSFTIVPGARWDVGAETQEAAYRFRSARMADLGYLDYYEALPIYGWTYTTAFHNAYVDLSARYQVPLVPFMLINVIGNPAMMQPDHVHPNAAGARAMANSIWPYLEPLLRSTAA